MTQHTELIARLEPFVHGLGKAVLRETADAIEALEASQERSTKYTLALQDDALKLQTEVERLTSEAMYCSEYSEPEDLMFERLERAARTSFRKHKSSIRGQQITRADSYESHLVWAAQQEMKAQLAAAQGQEPVAYMVQFSPGSRWVEVTKVEFDSDIDGATVYKKQTFFAAPIPQQPAPGVPEDWKLVPIEPTDEMTEAAWESEAVDYVGEYKRINKVDIAYKAMLAAAPQPKETK